MYLAVLPTILHSLLKAIVCKVISHLRSLGLRCEFTLRRHHCGRLLKSTFELLIGLFLDSLSVLELFDELHLQLLHLHDFLFLRSPHIVLVIHPVFMLSLNLLDTSSSVFFNLHRSQAFLLINDLILHAILLLHFKVRELLLLFILLLNYLGLLCFFPSRLEDSLLNFALFICSLLIDGVVLLGVHSLLLVLSLVVIDFLLKTQHGI